MVTPTTPATAASEQSGGGHAGAATSRSRIGWAGIIFSVLFVVGFAMAAGQPDNDAVDQAWVDWYADDANLQRTLVGAYLLIAAGFAFLVFAAGLLERVGGSREQSPVLHRVSWGVGLLASGFLMVAALQFAGIAGNITFGGAADVKNADLVRQNLGVATVLLVGAMAAAVFIACVATLARRSGLFGAAMTWFSYLVAVLLVLAVAFIPILALPIWALVAGIALLRKA